MAPTQLSTSLVLLSALAITSALCACANTSANNQTQNNTSQSPPPPNQPPKHPPIQPPNQQETTCVAPTPDTQDTKPSEETPLPKTVASNPVSTRTDSTQPVLSEDVRREVLPGIWVNSAQRTIDFEGTVAIDAHNPKTPIVYLEWIVCAPDTKEHESLVLTNIKPSHLHAALLLVGYQPGAPGEWKWEGATISSIPPRGDSLQVFVQPLTSSLVPETAKPPVPMTDWIVGKPKAQDQPKALSEHWPEDSFLFAGSIMINAQAAPAAPAIYKADREGGHIGLTTFGHEVIVWSRMFNPDSGIQAPYWIANSHKVPPFATPVRIIISPHQPQANP